MAGESITRARDAARALVDRLAPTDDFSLVTFSNEADVKVPDGPVGARREAIKKIIGEVHESTEWAEENAAMLTEKAVAYINIDVAVTGPNFGAQGVPSLRTAVREVAAMVPEPRKGGTVATEWERRLKDAAGRRPRR